MDVDEVADELYGVPPEEFVATRRAREEQARAEGDRVLAKAIAALVKPSLAAWATNVLVRAHREEIEGLVELGGLLREAQDNLAGDQLRALSVQRNQVLAALSRQVAALTRELGHPISAAVAGQVEETLRAAMADPDAGEAVLSGRLTSPLSYSGLGTGRRPVLRVVPPPREQPPAPARAGSGDRRRTATGPRRTATEERRLAAEERRRRAEEAARRAAEERRRRELAEAEHAADEAAAAAAAEQARVEHLDARHERLQARVEELADELARVREERTTIDAQRTRARRRRLAAGRRAADAATARDRALARLEELRRES